MSQTISRQASLLLKLSLFRLMEWNAQVGGDEQSLILGYIVGACVTLW